MELNKLWFSWNELLFKSVWNPRLRLHMEFVLKNCQSLSAWKEHFWALLYVLMYVTLYFLFRLTR